MPACTASRVGVFPSASSLRRIINPSDVPASLFPGRAKNPRTFPMRIFFALLALALVLGALPRAIAADLPAHDGVTFMEGAGHGFKRADAEKAEAAMIAFFDKYLKPAKP
jgi:hypothetical protein